MSTDRPPPEMSRRRLWWASVAAFVAAGAVWAVATPLFTGPDEVSQARRAAAVVRGELTGRKDRPGPPLLLTVEVPALYGEPAEQNWLCHVGPLVDGAPQEAMPLPSPPCPDLGRAADGAGSTVEAETVQYRGQPFFYGLVGVPTLVSDGVAGAYGMRMVGVGATAAFLASALVTAAASRRRLLAGLALSSCVPPGLLHLSGSTNPSAVEIAAALSAWAAVSMLATSTPEQLAEPSTRRLVRRLGVALVALVLCRGLGPGFAAAVVAVGGATAGRERIRVVLRRSDARWWASAVVVAVALSGAWLLFIGSEYPLPERAGSGFGRALGWLPWYLHQSVGVFGTNDSAVAALAAVAWWVVAFGVTVCGVVLLLGQRTTGRSRSEADRGSISGPRVAIAAASTLVVGLMVNVTAEGLSLPPIGFFWQGRYALPLALGGMVLATTARRPSHFGDAGLDGSGAGDGHTGSDDLRSASASASPGGRAGALVGGAVVATAVLVAVHVHAVWTVTGHHDVAGAARVVAAVVAGLAAGSVVVLAAGPWWTAGREAS